MLPQRQPTWRPTSRGSSYRAVWEVVSGGDKKLTALLNAGVDLFKEGSELVGGDGKECEKTEWEARLNNVCSSGLDETLDKVRHMCAKDIIKAQLMKQQ